MRLELHDASLVPEPEEDKPDSSKVQRSGLSGGLRKALGSLSSATMKVCLKPHLCIYLDVHPMTCLHTKARCSEFISRVSARPWNLSPVQLWASSEVAEVAAVFCCAAAVRQTNGSETFQANKCTECLVLLCSGPSAGRPPMLTCWRTAASRSAGSWGW